MGECSTGSTLGVATKELKSVSINEVGNGFIVKGKYTNPQLIAVTLDEAIELAKKCLR